MNHRDAQDILLNPQGKKRDEITKATTHLKGCGKCRKYVGKFARPTASHMRPSDKNTTACD